jgi:hydrogenase nickel incorporation protein HypB
VAVLSVTEGEDKPVKYPTLFREAKAVALTKMDLLPHLPFDLKACRAYLRQVNAVTPVFQVSAQTGRGMAAWIKWLREMQAESRTPNARHRTSER